MRLECEGFFVIFQFFTKRNSRLRENRKRSCDMPSVYYSSTFRDPFKLLMVFLRGGTPEIYALEVAWVLCFERRVFV